jgi:hypothetical protein
MGFSCGKFCGRILVIAVRQSGPTSPRQTVIHVAAVDVPPRARGHQRHDIAIFLEDDVAEARVVDRRARTAVGSFFDWSGRVVIGLAGAHRGRCGAVSLTAPLESCQPSYPRTYARP